MNDHALSALLDLERLFWVKSSQGDGEFYRTRSTDDALYVFPGGTGVLTRDECADIVDGNHTPWAWFEMDNPRSLMLADGLVLLTYTSRSQPEGGKPFSMRVSTIYRSTDEGWKLAFHQQTIAPMPSQENSSASG